MDGLCFEQQKMLEVLACALWNRGFDTYSEDIWSRIFGELRKQTVHILTVGIIDQTKLDTKIKNEYVKETAINLRKFHELMMEQDELLSLFCNHGIKGAAAAVYYPIPEYRCMGDIDIIVKPADFDDAFDLLCKHGYRNEQQLKDGTRHIGFRTEFGNEVELHRHFSYSFNMVQNIILDQYIYNAIDKLEIKEVCGYSIPMLPAFENGLVILSHINQHLSGGLGLRQIIDWMLYVKAELSDDNWERFSRVAEAIGMRKLAETTTYMCKKYLGLENVTWCDQADAALSDELMRYILDKGNFGRNYNNENRMITKVMHSFHNPISTFRYLTAGGMSHWKAARKYIVLRPFAWIYQLGYLLRIGQNSITSVNTFSTELKQNKREADLLKKLGVTNI